MQRSAAKSGVSEPSTPQGPPSKKARLSSGGSTPGTPKTPYTPEDAETMRKALAAEEKKREEALARAYEHTGETKWVLSYNDPYAGKRPPVMQVRQAGFAAIDADDDSEEEEDKPVRMQFGGGLKKTKAVRGNTAGTRLFVFTDGMQGQASAAADADASGSESDSSSGSDDDEDMEKFIRKTARKAEASKRAPKVQTPTLNRTIDEDMDLSGLTSLSGGRPTPGRDMSNMECFGCGKKGHMRSECPNPRASTGRGRGGRGGQGGRGPARY